MAIPTIQTAFVFGEVSPSLFGHVDLARMHAAASTMRNMTVSYRGGAYSRAGTAFVGFSKQTGRLYPPRLLPFAFSVRQGLALEFGHLYMRVISNGAFVTEEPISITGITRANPAVVAGTISAASATPNNAAVSASYVPGNTVTLAGGTFTTAAVLTVVDTLLKSLALNSPGTGVYAPGDTVLLTGGTQSTPAVLSVSTTKVVSATIAATGAGGTPGSQTVTGTTGTGTKFQATVTVSGGGLITSVDAISLAGSYTVNPTAPSAEPVTGAGLVGAQLNVKLGIATFAVFAGGVFTVNAPGATFTQASTSGTGTGATFQTAVFGINSVSVSTPGNYTVFPANPVAQGSTSGTGAGAAFNVDDSGVGSLSNGDWVSIASVGGMTQVNGQTYVVTNLSGSTFELYDVYGNPINSSAFSAYTSGGTASRIYTLTTPYSEADLEYIKYTQSADVMSLCCINQETLAEYEAQDLSRISDDSWTLGPIVPSPSIQPPTSISLTKSSAGSLTYQYAVTSVSPEDGTESISSVVANIASAVDIFATSGTIIVTWSGVATVSEYNVYKATPGVSVAPPVGALFGYIGKALGTQFLDTNSTPDFSQVPPQHRNPFARGQVLAISMTAIGGGYSSATATVSITTGTGVGFIGRPVVGNALSGVRLTFSSNPFTVGQIVSQNFGKGVVVTGSVVAATATTIDCLYISSGFGFLVGYAVTNEFGSSETPVSVASITVTGTDGITGVLIDDPGHNYLSTDTVVFSGATGSGAIGTLTIGPISGTYPSVPAYIQQRRAYAGTLNNPNTYWMSQPGAFTNFDFRIPTISSDSFSGTPWSVQVNGIQFMVDMPGGLVVFTGAGAWQLTGAGGSSFTPQPIGPDSQQVQPQASNGCAPTVAPVKIDDNILFVQAKGYAVREVSYRINSNIYSGADITINSPHLFNDFNIREMVWCEEPFKILWAARSDGTLLSLTYVKSQDVMGWARSDTNGLVQSICSVTEPPVDALYLAAQRFPGSNTAYMLERMNNRLWANVEDCWCVDCGLALAQPEPAATLTSSSATGLGACTGVTALIGGAVYSSGTTAVVVDDNGNGPGTGAVVALTILAGVITAVTFPTPGTGYVRPALVITDPANTGSGASATITLSNAAIFTASAGVFSAPVVGRVIRMGGGKAVITAYTDPTHVTVNITSPITDVIPNSGGRVRPQVSGTWTMTTPATIISGLNHLAGATVTGLADGEVITPTVVPSTGIINLAAAASDVVVGLGFQAQLQSTYLDVGNPTVQGQRKKIAAATARIELSRGLKIGCNQPDGSTLSPPQLTPAWSGLTAVTDKGIPPYGSSIKPLYTGDVRIPISGGYATPGQVCVQQDYPLPMNVLAFVSEVLPGDLPQTREPRRGGREEE